MSVSTKYQFYGPEFKRNPHPTYAAMRALDPVIQQPGLAGDVPIWFVTRFADMQAVLSDNETFVLDARLAFDPDDPRMAQFQDSHPVVELVHNNLLSKDGEDHRRLRALVQNAFTPRMVLQLRPAIEAIANDLLDRVVAQGQMDLIESYAFPLPIIVILEMLGIPPDDRNRFRA